MSECIKNKKRILVILALKATKLLRHKCRGFLETVIDKENDEAKIENIAVIREYLNVFLEDLSGLPLDRKAKFSIDILVRELYIEGSL